MSASRTSLSVLGFLAAVLVSKLATGPRAEPATAEDRPQAKAAVAPSDENKEGKTKNKGRGKFTISKETTYVTEPLDKDGYPDYARALNQRLRQGVTPENNANVLLWKALGPKPAYKPMPAEFFQELGMPAPPEKGDYFIDDFRYMTDHLKIEVLTEEFLDQSVRAMERAWTAKEYPNQASWLEANEKALALAVEASKRTQYYAPRIPSKRKNGSPGLISALFDPGAQKCRQMAGVLATRAMLRLGEGKYEEAWQDLLACHRLGRLIGRAPFLIDSLIGIAIDGVARRGCLAFMDSAHVGSKRLERCLGDLQGLPPVPKIAESADLGERLFFLDTLQQIDRDPSQFLESISISLNIAGGSALLSDPSPWPSGDQAKSKVLKLLSEVMEEDIDWDPALREVNGWCDRLAAVARGKDRSIREKQWEQIESEVIKLRKQVESEAEAEAFHHAKDKAAAGGRVIVDIEISLLHPALAVHKVLNAADRIKQELDNLEIAFALTWYYRDHGHYPKSLDQLAPKYLKQIPQDIFSGKPLIYRPSEKGFLLYSVGYNGKDDGGHDREDDPPGDDLVVRIPLPELAKK